MSKERLETAKLMAKMLRTETRLPHDFPFDLIDWLVEQAERVYELESDSYNAHLERLLDRKEQEIERYREMIDQIKNNIPLEFNLSSEYEAKKNVIRLMNIDNLVNEYLEGESDELG